MPERPLNRNTDLLALAENLERASVSTRNYIVEKKGKRVVSSEGIRAILDLGEEGFVDRVASHYKQVFNLRNKALVANRLYHALQHLNGADHHPQIVHGSQAVKK